MPLAVCATPIGNLDDVTLRVLAELREADVVLCEDTRRTRILLGRHGVEASLVSFHRHNEAARTQEALVRLERGERIALVSDAGLPGVNDPGARLIAAALRAGVSTTVLPGPSAVETALVASGLVGDRYQFVGYLPRRAGELEALTGELARWPYAVVAFESPRRLPRSLSVLGSAMPERRAAICRELTKRFEEVVPGTLAELAARFHEPPRGEITLVLGEGEGEGGVVDEHARGADLAGAIGELLAAGMGRREAADLVSRLTGVPRNELYRASL
jgi:16S rRNA (cytidine1402-2'-O)-methyltransferase